MKHDDAAHCAIDGQPVTDNATLCHDCTNRLEATLLALAGRVRPLAGITLPELPAGTTTDELPAGVTIARLPAGTALGRPTLALDHDHRPGLAAELELAITRQSVFGRRNGPRGHDKPVPYDDKAATTRTRLLAHLRDAVHRIGWQVPPEAPPGALAAILLADIDRLRRHPDAGELASDIAHDAARVRAAIDRAPDRAFLGRCGAVHKPGGDPCDGELYANDHEPRATCHTCGTSWDVDTRKRALLCEAHDRLLPAVDAARALTALGDPVTEHRIRVWADRGRLIAHGHLPASGTNRRPRPLYRVGDIVDLLTTDRVRRSRKATSA